jgi:hydroxymethylpyrimidine/phosphomethylpyrimidine kinase
MPIAMTIAGSDSGGGAGIQADLKTFAALGVYGTSAITAITAQNTLGVVDAYDLPVTIIAAQIDAILADIPPDTVKTGMLSSPAIIRTVAAKVREYQLRFVVVDPVMIAKSGHALLQPEAVATLIGELVPLAYVITPNLPEAGRLVGGKITTLADMRAAAARIHELGAANVVVKGGHLASEPVDVLFDGQQYHEFRGERIATTSTHGTGCTFSSAIAALLARGQSPLEAVAGAKEYITEAIRRAPGIGHGHGPVEHFWRFSGQAAMDEKD